MPRELRFHEPGSYRHFTARADDAGPLFRDDQDRRAFLGTLADVTRRVEWSCLGWCLMTTLPRRDARERRAPPVCASLCRPEPGPGLCAAPEAWPWSSYGQLVGVDRPASFLSRAHALWLFDARPERAVELVRRFVDPVPGTEVPGTEGTCG